MNIPEHMVEQCAGLRMAADLTRDYEAYEVYEDMENLFAQMAETLENEPDTIVRPFVEGMGRALNTAAHVAQTLRPPAMLEWLGSRNRKGETAGETCVYGDLHRLYDYLNDLYERKAPLMGEHAERALTTVAGELEGAL